MKGSNSRFSHRPERRYSNTAQIQGGMVTDADLTEAGQLHQARDEAQNLVTTGSGVPAQDGVVGFVNELPELRQGWVLAEGKQGRLVAGNGDAGLVGKELFSGQADLPQGPGLPDGRALLYADLWERPIFALQDPYLADPGLHGAETSYRTRTMVQIKALPLSNEMTEDQARADLADGTGLFRRTGDALVSVTPKNTEIAVDDCDPCADAIDIVPTVPNALFRLEVVEVKRNAKGKALHARFAWSMDNAAVIETMAQLSDPATGAAMKAAFARDTAVYEYFSDVTEAQIGRFASGFTPQAPEFRDNLTETAASHVRRWDGSAEVNLKNSTVTNGSNLGQGKMTAAAGKAELTVDAFSVKINFNGHEILAGDYWLIELRRFAPEAERVRLVGGAGNKDATPVGVRHHFCALFLVDNGESLVPQDDERRRLSFPGLIDIPASHVSFTPDCPPFFDSAENVAEALNALCDLSASQVGFSPPADCERFEGVETVDEALARLCSVQDDTMLTRVLRVMMDWGVVCGIRFRLLTPRSTKIAWTAGTMLDRRGRLIDVKAGQFDLRELGAEHIPKSLLEVTKKEGEICLSIAAGDKGALEFFLTDKATAFGPPDPTFNEAVKACIEFGKGIDFGGIYRPLKPVEAGIVKKLADVWANRKTLDGKVPLSKEEAVVTKAVNNTLVGEYMAKVDPERQEEITHLISLAEEQLNPNAVRGTVRDIRRMQLESMKFGIIATAEEEDRISCRCRHGLTPCPPELDKFGHLVPVACIKLVEGTPDVSPISELCDFCCRKQAMNWRSYRYYHGSFFDKLLPGLKEECCRPRGKPDVDVGKWVDDWVVGIYEPNPKGPRPDPVPEPDPIWPPIRRPEVVLPINPGYVDPVPYDPGKFINPRPVIDRLPSKEAITVLTGNGFDVVQTIDLDDGTDPLASLGSLGVREDSVIGRETPEPGDQVVMMARGGKAVDFLVVKKGVGKLPFETDAETTKRVEKAVASLGLNKKAGDRPKVAPPAGEAPRDVSATSVDTLQDKLAELEKKRGATEIEITKLANQRDELATDVDGLETRLKDIATLHEKFDIDIKDSRDELNKIDELKITSLKDIEATTKELNTVKASHAKFVLSMRREQPIEAVLGNNAEAIKILKLRGIVTVGDIEKTNTTTLTSTLRRTGMTGTAAKKLAREFVVRR